MMETTRLLLDGDRARLFRRKFGLQVKAGPDDGLALSSAASSFSIGTAAQNDLVLSDPAISRYHLRIEITPAGFRLTDLDSTNGTRIGGLRLGQCLADTACDINLGETVIQFTPLGEEQEVPLHPDDEFGALRGSSPAMLELFSQLQLASPREVTILVEGETGTGKELIAREIHLHSPRRNGPFVVVDCGAIPPTLIESELFGHARGSFTGAHGERPGALESANGGTIFLDEIGELELSMQPRLLRALEERQVKRVGENHHRRIDIRVVAATNRDLLRAVNTGTFRADLFYRLAVVHLRVPPLRQRPEDIELLVRYLLPEIARRLDANPPRLDGAARQQLISHPWPGNVRELRNFLERMILFSRPGAAFPAASEENAALAPRQAFKAAKARCVDEFERGYFTELLESCGGNVAEAARRAGIDRVHLFRLIKKHGLQR